MSTQSAGGSRLRRGAARGAGLGQRLAQAAVGRHSADDRELAAARGLERPDGALDELPDDRGLVARGEVGPRVGKPVAELAHAPQERRLQAREREIMPVLPAQHRREREARGIAVARDELERRASGIAQAEQARALVERLARSVVTRAAEPQRCRVVGDVQHERVPTRGQQARERRRQAERREPQRRHVPEQVVDGDERQAAAVGQGLGGREPDEQRADQSRSLRDRDGIHIGERRPRVGERGLDDGHDELEVAPRRDLGHDAAEARVQVGLRRADRARARAPSRVTTAAQVSSHEVSMARITGPSGRSADPAT